VGCIPFVNHAHWAHCVFILIVQFAKINKIKIYRQISWTTGPELQTCSIAFRCCCCRRGCFWVHQWRDELRQWPSKRRTDAAAWRCRCSLITSATQRRRNEISAVALVLRSAVPSQWLPLHSIDSISSRPRYAVRELFTKRFLDASHAISLPCA